MTVSGIWSVISSYYLIIGFNGMESRQSCIWRFHACNRSSDEEACNFVQRQWCSCNQTVQNHSISQDGYCESNELRVLRPDDSESAIDIPSGGEELCNRSACEAVYIMCQWERWTLSLNPPCGPYVQQRRRFKCCHPVTKRRRVELCEVYEWDIRYRHRLCTKRNSPSGSDGKRFHEEAEKNPMMKVLFVFCGFGIFMLLAAIIGKKVGRPICQSRRRGRRSSPPIVIELPSKREAPIGVVIPQPGQPLIEYQGK